MKKIISLIMVMVLMLGMGSVFANDWSGMPDDAIMVDNDGERTWAEEKENQEQAENTFSDLGSHWGRTNIMRLYNMGGISGYPDGTVKPDGTVTRAEFLALASKTIYPEKVGKAKSGEHWAKPFFDTAWANGTVSPKFLEENTWNDNITRYEMAEIIVRFLEKIIDEESQNVLGVEGIMEDYEEVSTNMHSYYVQQAFVKGIITGRNANGLFAGNDNGTRAEAATLIIRLIDTNARKEVVLDTSGQVVEEEETNEGEYASEDWDDFSANEEWDKLKEEADSTNHDYGQNFVITGTFIDKFNEDSLEAVNEVRAENGAGPLKLSDLAIEIAQYKSEDMLSLYKDGEPYDVYFAHESKNYGDLSDLKGLFNWTSSIGENLGHDAYLTKEKMTNGGFAESSVKEGFAKSPGHFKNMINPKWTKVGFGVTFYYDEENRIGRFLITQTFLK